MEKESIFKTRTPLLCLATIQIAQLRHFEILRFTVGGSVIRMSMSTGSEERTVEVINRLLLAKPVTRNMFIRTISSIEQRDEDAGMAFHNRTRPPRTLFHRENGV